MKRYLSKLLRLIEYSSEVNTNAEDYPSPPNYLKGTLWVGE